MPRTKPAENLDKARTRKSPAPPKVRLDEEGRAIPLFTLDPTADPTKRFFVEVVVFGPNAADESLVRCHLVGGMPTFRLHGGRRFEYPLLMRPSDLLTAQDIAERNPSPAAAAGEAALGGGSVSGVSSLAPVEEAAA